MTDQATLQTFTGSSEQAAEVMDLVNIWRAALARAEGAPLGAASMAMDPDRLSLAMTAAAIMAGTFTGHAIVAGLMEEGDKRRATEAFARNYRTGIDIGRRMALRAAVAMPVGGHA